MLSPALKYFREAAVHGSVRRAAEHLAVAPSAISRQIARLELELGTALLDRRSRRMALTDAGTLVLAHAERAMQETGDLRAALRDLTGLRSGRVRIASIEGMVTYFLARYLANFEKRFPGIAVQVSVIGSRAVLDALRSHEVDMALAFNVPVRSPFQEHARLEQPLCVIVAPSHPLAQRKSVSFKELSGERIALPDRSFQIRFLVERIAARMRVNLKLAIETNTLEMAKGVVRNSQLVTFLPRYAALREVSNEELSAVPLREREFTATSASLLTSKTHQLSAAARALLETLKAAMATYRGP
jgi:DNA-binding transcriptional LysR family regulator